LHGSFKNCFMCGQQCRLSSIALAKHAQGCGSINSTPSQKSKTIKFFNFLRAWVRPQGPRLPVLKSNWFIKYFKHTENLVQLSYSYWKAYAILYLLQIFKNTSDKGQVPYIPSLIPLFSFSRGCNYLNYHFPAWLWTLL
jgi:hypothetical protein